MITVATATVFFLLLTSLQVRSNNTVDLVLVLALDISASVDDQEFDLQRRGLASAITHPSVIEAIRNGREKRIGVAAVQWSGEHQQFVSVPWQIIDGAGSAEKFAERLLGMQRRSADGEAGREGGKFGTTMGPPQG